MIRSLVPQQAWKSCHQRLSQSRKNDDPVDIAAVMSHSDTLTTNVPLLIGEESTTPVTPVNFPAIPGECMQCERLKNSLRKYQKEKSRLRRDQIGRSCTYVITIIVFMQLVFMDSSSSTGIGITINKSLENVETLNCT